MARVLIVDNERPVCEELRKLLETEGHGCVLAANASEARECLKRNSVQLVICDINISGKLGLDFIRDILAEYPATATIMLSEIDDPTDLKNYLEIGVYDFIIKPVLPNDLLFIVANVLRRRELEIERRNYMKHLKKTVTARFCALEASNVRSERKVNNTDKKSMSVQHWQSEKIDHCLQSERTSRSID